MAADYTRTIVFKVEDQAIKRATNQIVTSLKRIETVLEKIHQKGFSKIAADADKVASGIDKATAALNKYNKELARAQKQKALPAAKELLEPGATKQPGRVRRVGMAVERAAARVAGTVGIAGGAGLTAYVAAIRAVNVSVNKAISISPKFANFLGLVEQKTNGLTIATNVLRDAYSNHPITAGVISVALVALGIDFKKTTTAAMWFGRVAERISRPVRKLALDFNPIEAALNRITGQARITSKALMGLGGVRFNPLDSVFPIDASKRTIDVTPIQGGESGKGYARMVEKIRFSEAQRARGNDLRQKLGIRGRISANVEASRRSRAASGFADFEADLRGLKTATAKDAIVKSIERKNRRLEKLKKSQLNIDKLLNKNMRKRLGMNDEAIAFEGKMERMFSRKARKNRRRGAQERLFSMRTGMDPREAENLMLGFGFPMLFGGGVGAVGGGVGGAALGNMMGMQGFGTQIIGSALGTAVDSFVTATAEVGKALGEFTRDTGALVEAMGIAGTAEAQRIKNIEKLEGEQAAFDATVNRLTATIGETGTQRLKDFGEKWTDLMMLMQTKLLKLRQAVAGILLGFDKLMGYSEEARKKRMMVFAREQGGDDVKKLLKEYDAMPGGIGIKGKRKEKKGQEILSKVTGDFDKMSAQAAIDRNLGEGDKTPQEKLKAEKDRLELIFLYGEREAAIQTKINELKDKGVKYDAEAIRKSMEQTYYLQDINELYKGIGQTIKDGLVEGINEAIDGTKTLGEVASSVFKKIGNALLSYGLDTALGGIPGLSKIFGRASGGPVSGGTPYVVGEKGPELFVPGSSGNIVPNHAMGGTNVVVNVDASGSSVEGDVERSRQLGELIGAAVQSEIIRQKRPGGTLF